MAKILISRDGTLEQTVQLSRERMTIGRRRHHDIVLDHPTVSGEHAVITTILDDSFLEDLYSTNGTFVNGHRIGKHYLQNNDVIQLAKYRIEFIADGIRPLTGAALSPAALHPAAASLPAAVIEVLNGSNAGKRLALTKAQTSLGRSGVQVVVISRGGLGYAATHTEGDLAPLLNGAALARQPQPLADGDVLDLSGTRMAFRLV